MVESKAVEGPTEKEGNSSSTVAASVTEEEEKESLVMDFSTAFKATTRRGKKKKGVVAKKAVSENPADGTDELEPDALDNVNRDLEDDNLFLADDSNLLVEKIPRNLTIT